MDPFDNPLIPKPMVICDDRNNPPDQKQTLCETYIAMCSREGATILRTLGWNIADFPPGAFFSIRNSIDENGVVTSALIHTAPGGSIHDEYMIPSVPVPRITLKSDVTKDGATFAEFVAQHSSEDLSEVSTNQQSFEDLIRHEPESDFKQLLREQHATQNPNYNPQEAAKKFAEIGDSVIVSNKAGVTFTEEQIKESRQGYLEPWLRQTSEALEPLIKDLDWIEKFEDFCNEHDIDYRTMESNKVDPPKPKILGVDIKTGTVVTEENVGDFEVYAATNSENHQRVLDFARGPEVKAKTIKLTNFKNPVIGPDSPSFVEWFYGRKD